MSKKIRKILAMVLVMNMFVSVLSVQALAAGEESKSTETSPNGLTTNVTTTTTTATDESGNTTVTVTIEKATEGTTADGTELNREETHVESTTTNSEGVEVSSQWTETGKETTTEQSSETPDVNVDLIKDGEAVENPSGSTAIAPPVIPDADPREGEDDTVYDEITNVETTDREVTAELNVGAITENKVIYDADGNVLDSYESDKNTGLNPISSQWDENKEDVRKSAAGMTEEELKAEDEAGNLPSIPLTKGEIKAALDKKLEGYDYLYIGLGEDSCFGVGWNYKSDDSYNNYGTGTNQFALGDFSAGSLDAETMELIVAYCADVETSSRKGYWYKVENLEDAEYYDEESANHIRAIASKAYWGTVGTNEDGTPVTGSLAAVKAMMAEAKDADGNAVFSQAQIDGLTEGEALTASQMAIWKYANPYQAEGKDIYLDADRWDYVMYQGKETWGQCAGYLKDEIKAQIIAEKGLDIENLTEEELAKLNEEVNNRYLDKYNAAMDRIDTLADYLMGLTQTAEEAGTTKIINEKNFVKDMSMTVGAMVKENANGNGNNSYNVDFSFSLVVVPGKDDDLIVKVVNSDGEIVGSGRIAGDAAEGEQMNQVEITYDADGKPVYTLKGLELIEGSNAKFNLKLEGAQYLEQGVYIYTSEVREDAYSSQTFVGMAEGYKSVDVAMEVDLTFHVQEGTVTTVREWANEGSSNYTPANPENPDKCPENPAEPLPCHPGGDGGDVETPDGDVPLADVPATGDESLLWIAVIMMALLALYVVNVISKKRTHGKHEAF